MSTDIAVMLLGAIAGLLLGSCIRDRDVECDAADVPGDRMQFMLRISAVGNETAQQQTGVVETVKSLRVIVIDKNGRLDINEQVSLPVEEYTAKNFNYIFIRNLTPGDKRIFLIANETSVGGVILPADVTSAKNIPLTSLTAMLDSFTVDSDDGETGTGYTGDDFAEVLNSVYFRNDYSQMTAGKTIALPYSAYYEVQVEDKTLTRIERPMYLVPVAAKFDFVFTNYRKHNAYIDDVIISSINSHNYLNARLDDSEKRRELGDVSDVWWIDWLEACAEGSQSAEDTDEYNSISGWITKYELPVADEPMVDLSLNGGKEAWMLTGLVDKANPSRILRGPYYVPESCNIPAPGEDDDADDADTDPDDGGAAQSYSLTFKVHDQTETVVTTLEGYVIDTLKALFRATHTIVYVDLYESEAEIYAEIVPWTERLFLGYVQQDEEYD